MPAGEPVVALRGVRKDYHGIRPLRVERLELREAETIALIGLDRAAAEVLVNLMTGATLPDAGEVELFGAPTHGIPDSDAWFRLLDRIGILSERVVLLDELTVEQNLALPITLDVETLAPDVRARVERLGAEIGLAPEILQRPLGAVDQTARARIRLGKALALDPRVLLAEHPNAVLPPTDVPRFAADLSGIAAQRRLAMLVLTADERFGAAACARLLSVQPASGAVAPRPGWRQWLGRPAR
jgi:predicted ABC-type transport system involved in lysophospholipase L1 biosynthesis ATPase subunit